MPRRMPQRHQQNLAPSDAVSKRTHRDKETSDHEAVDVIDPENFCRIGIEIRNVWQVSPETGQTCQSSR